MPHTPHPTHPQRDKPASPKRDLLFQKIAGDIRQQMESGQIDRLPSIRDLARQFHVSYQTMWKTARLLSQQGVIRCFQGQTISSAASAQQRPPDGLPAVQGRIFDALRKRILEGSWQAGDPLPKVVALAHSEGVSANTVVETLRRLAEEHLIHKRGKRWFAGPPAPAPRAPEVLVSDDLPVVVLLMRQQRNLSQFYNRAHTAAFSIPFKNELTKYNMQLTLALNEHDEHFPISGVIPTGRESVVPLIRSLGKRYRGTIIAGLLPDLAGTVAWIDELAPLGQPVVFFDFPDTTGARSIRKPAWKRYCRMHLDERAAVGLAVRTLADLGHHMVCLPVYPAQHFPWTYRRRDLAVEVAAQAAPATRIVSSELSEPFWRIESETPPPHDHPVSNVETFFRQMMETGGSKADRVRRFGNELLSRTPSLTNLIRDHRPTAIIAPNDDFARELYFWLRSVGATVPERMSLISFDNMPESMVFPISTIDFGFAQLGYLAAHACIGDIPIKTDRQGNIPGICRIINRGSLAKPPARAFAVG